MRIWISLLLLVSLSGCLKTRSEIEDGGTSGNMRTGAGGTYVTGSMGQQQRAQIDSRFFEIDRDFRELYGKIETLERNLDEVKTKPAVPGEVAGKPADNTELKALEKRISTIEEALLALDKKVTSLGGKGSSASTKITPKKAKGPFGQGEILFDQGKFEEAIASYDKYRKRYPRGRRYAQATLKMGLCFQKLKMNQDAKAFYKEVIQRYPNTRVSIRAQENLKRL